MLAMTVLKTVSYLFESVTFRPYMYIKMVPLFSVYQQVSYPQIVRLSLTHLYHHDMCIKLLKIDTLLAQVLFAFSALFVCFLLAAIKTDHYTRECQF